MDFCAGVHGEGGTVETGGNRARQRETGRETQDQERPQHSSRELEARMGFRVVFPETGVQASGCTWMSDQWVALGREHDLGELPLVR